MTKHTHVPLELPAMAANSGRRDVICGFVGLRRCYTTGVPYVAIRQTEGIKVGEKEGDRGVSGEGRGGESRGNSKYTLRIVLTTFVLVVLGNTVDDKY